MRHAALLLALLVSGCGKGATGTAVRQIHIAGSSAAFPFSTAAAERLMRDQPDVLAPLVRAGGSGAGIAAFCSGTGLRFPDIVVVTRAPTAAEQARCRHNGVNAAVPMLLGRTGFVLVSTSPLPGLDRAHFATALTGPALLWSDIDPSFPHQAIRIHGPAPAPGLADGVDGLLAAAGGHPRLRRDGAYVGHGADAERIAEAVLADPQAIGILPYAQALEHADRLHPIPLDGVPPTAETIATGRYPATAPLLLLAKREGLPATPGLAILLSYYRQDAEAGGAFAAKGLVLPDPPAGPRHQ